MNNTLYIPQKIKIGFNNRSDTYTKKLSCFGFTFSQWSNDFKTRLNQIELSENKRKLEVIETKLNGKISKEYREKLELEEIKKELGI
jgi:hypothetical protein